MSSAARGSPSDDGRRDGEKLNLIIFRVILDNNLLINAGYATLLITRLSIAQLCTEEIHSDHARQFFRRGPKGA